MNPIHPLKRLAHLALSALATFSLAAGLLSMPLPAQGADIQYIPPETGSLDGGFNPGTGADNSVYAVASQPDGKVLIAGAFTTFNGETSSRIARLNPDGSLDHSFNPGTGANNAIRTIVYQSNGKVLIGGQFTEYNGVSRSRIARLNSDGTLDTGFDPGGGPNDTVRDIALQPDGKILIGGAFTQVNGVNRSRVARLDVNGSLDSGFDPAAGPNNYVYSIDLLPTGQVIIGGLFTQVSGAEHLRIALLASNGAVDSSFTTAMDAAVYSLAVQSDGKVLAGGSFTHVNGDSLPYLVRLGPSRTPDTTFEIGSGPNNAVYALAIQPDGKLWIGGAFSSVDGSARSHVALLLPAGSLILDAENDGGPNNDVLALSPCGYDRAMAGGLFTTVSGISRSRVARINPDGSADAALNPGVISSSIYEVVLQANGKILIGGTFTSVNGTSRNRIARLDASGALDTNFNPGTGADETVKVIAALQDGKTLIGGGFTHYNGTAQAYLARVNADGSLDSTFTPVIDGAVRDILVRPDDKIYVAGRFANVNGTSSSGIALLTTTGALDATFNPGTGANSGVEAMARQNDGKIILGGTFKSFNGSGVGGVVRLNLNGSIDTSFDTDTGISGTSSYPNRILVQPDGKILLSGPFSNFNGDLDADFMIRLTDTGQLDDSFLPSGVPVNDFAQQSDGKIVIGGDWDTIHGENCADICRLNANGTLDTSFDTGSGVTNDGTLSNQVQSLVLQPNGKVVIGGNFKYAQDVEHSNIARLNGASEPHFTNSAPGNGLIGQAYAFGFNTDGYPTPTFSVTEGNPPPGLTLYSLGGLIGTPTAAGEFQFSVAAANGLYPPAIQVVNITIQQGSTTTAITSHLPNPSAMGGVVTVAFGVTATAPASGTPTGTVTVSDGDVSCSAEVSAGSCELVFEIPGVKTLTAAYAGDSNFTGSTSASVSHQVNLVKSDTTTAITSHQPNPSTAGDAVTVTFTVNGVPASGAPTGTVTVSDGDVSCSAEVSAGSCELVFETPGAKTLTASYAGDDNFNGSTSGNVSHQVQVPPEEDGGYKVHLPLLTR